MENKKPFDFIAVAGLATTIITSIFWVVFNMITSPKLKILSPKRVLRSWAPIFSGRNYQSAAPGTVTNDYIFQMREEEKLKESDIDIRYYIHIPVENNTVFRYERTTAKDVSAKLIFYNLENQYIGEFEAKWENADQYIIGMNKNKSKVISIHGGKIENIDIASRRVTGDEWFVMNMDSYDNPHSSETRNNKIGKGGFVVHVKPHCQNSRVKEVTYKIVDNGTAEPTYILIKKL